MKIQDIENVVVVPWDFSDMARQALESAVRMVADPALIRVLHVTEHPSAYEYGFVGPTATNEQITARLEEAFLERTADNEVLSGLDFRVMFGNPGSQICQFAGEVSAELIVMPSHGRSGMSRLLLGSVAERVIRFAPCPVLILREAPVAQEASAVGQDASAEDPVTATAPR